MAEKSDHIVVNDIFSKKRENKLNIIFFVSASKTYSFALPLSIFFILATFIVAILLWSALSFTWLTKTKYANAQLDSELRLLKSKLFEYQSRYEDVYGLIKSPVEDPVKVIDESIDESQPITEVEEEARVEDSATIPGSFEQVQDQEAQDQEVQGQQAINTNKLDLDIKNVRMQRSDGAVSLSFLMQNAGQYQQRGAVKAYIEVEDVNSKARRYITSTSTPGLSSTNFVQGAGVNFRFNNAVAKNLEFEVPAESQLLKVEVQAFSSNCKANWIEGQCNRLEDFKRSSYRINPLTAGLSTGNIALTKASDSTL